MVVRLKKIGFAPTGRTHRRERGIVMRKALYILGELEDSDIDWLITSGKKERIPVNEILIQEGEESDALYIVLGGNFSVSIAALNNQEVSRVGPAEVLGEISYVDSRPPSATVRAAEESLVLSIPRPKLSEKLKQDMGFAARFYRAIAVVLAYRLRDIEARSSAVKASPSDTEADFADPDELDLDMLDKASRAGARFERMLKRLREA